MDIQINKRDDEIEINLLHLVKVLLSKIWIIIISILLCGAIAFSYAFFFVTPKYESRAMLYVNNSNISLGSASLSITSSELSAAKSLLDVYVIILSSRTTLEAVIEQADLDYTYKELSKMVSAGSVNGTEVFDIVVTSDDPAEAERIVNTIVEILPKRIADIIQGSSVRIVDTAVIQPGRVSPSYSKYTIVGMLLGAVLSCGVIIVLDLLDTSVRDEDYLIEKYGLPVLGVIPDLNAKKSPSYAYYKKSSKDDANNK